VKKFILILMTVTLLVSCSSKTSQEEAISQIYFEIADEDESAWQISKMESPPAEGLSLPENSSSPESSNSSAETVEEPETGKNEDVNYVYILYEDSISQVYSGDIFGKFRVSGAKSMYSPNIFDLEAEITSESEFLMKAGSLLYESSDYALSSAEVNFWGKTEKIRGPGHSAQRRLFRLDKFYSGF
jgi:hypothetical protein